VKSDSIRLSKSEQAAYLHFPSLIAKGQLTLLVRFKGVIDESMRGFFRTKYRSQSADANGECQEKNMLVTQFEPCSARKAFPCFDEPHLKATFELCIEAPYNMCVLSNTPVASEKIVEGSVSKLKRHTFQETPVMSTYVSSQPYMSNGRKLILHLATVLGHR
jgi:aminopeptidase N